MALAALSTFDFLDPASLFAKINADKAASVDNFALLDPLRAEAQIETAYSKTGQVYTAHALGPRFTDQHWTPVSLTAALA